LTVAFRHVSLIAKLNCRVCRALHNFKAWYAFLTNTHPKELFCVKSFNKTICFFENIAGNPVFGGITAIISVVAGGLASFFTDEIKSAIYPFFWLKDGVFSWTATSFWASVIAAGMCLAAGQWSQSRKADRSSKRLEAMVAKLETLPTARFLPDWRSLCRLTLECLFVATREQSDRETLEQLIRNVLGAIALVAKGFDEVLDGEYTANVMLWHKCDLVNQVKLEGTNHQNPMKWNNGDSGTQGILELVPMLSATCEPDENGKFSPDPNAKWFILPVADNTLPVFDGNNNERNQVLPGATSSFVAEEFILFINVNEFARAIDDKTSINAHEAKALKDYFKEGEGRHIKSFGSIPIIPIVSILGNDPQGISHSQAIGILNIHSTRPNMLANNASELFLPLLEPFLVTLFALLNQRQVLLSK